MEYISCKILHFGINFGKFCTKLIFHMSKVMSHGRVINGFGATGHIWPCVYFIFTQCSIYGWVVGGGGVGLGI